VEKEELLVSGEEVYENGPITFDEIVNGVATSATNLKLMRNKRLNLIIFYHVGDGKGIFNKILVVS